MVSLSNHEVRAYSVRPHDPATPSWLNRLTMRATEVTAQVPSPDNSGRGVP
jgi:hypothetical protein